MLKKLKRQWLIYPTLVGLYSCSTPSAITEKSTSPALPTQWQASQKQSVKSVQLEQWLTSFNDQTLNDFVSLALEKNYSLQAQRAQVAIAKERVIVTNATDFPELSLGLGNSRRKTVSSSDSVNYQTNADIDLQLSYEVDIWGKLSDEQSQAQLNYASAQATYKKAELDLIANVTRAWFNLIEAQQLLTLYQERADNLHNNLEIIQAAYRLGLNDALDVYLTQNDVSRELARATEQQQVVVSRSRTLELLLGEYPQAKRKATATLPSIDTSIELGLPAQLLTRRPDIVSSWYQLMALDAGLAVAHKQRFPRFALSGSTGDSSDDLSNLLDGGSLAWSLIGNITVPLFNAGRLESLEEQARLAVTQKEQLYLQEIFAAFAEVENNLSNRQSLTQRYQHFETARENAVEAETLSFNQYLRGLVTYTTVLESQRRAFDAQTTSIQLSNQLLQNRVNLYVSLGGSALPENTNENPNTTSTPLALLSK